MEKERKSFLKVLRNNAVYIVLALCILATGLTVSLVLISKKSENRLDLPENNVIVSELPDDNQGDNETQVPTVTPEDGQTPQTNTEPVDNKIEFIIPVENYTSINEFSDTMVFNSTLKRYASHKSTDFIAEEGTKVFAVYGGTVESVDNTLLTGYTVTIDHGNGLKTVYNSLADGDSVTVGQKVVKGEVIGTVSNTNRQEFNQGSHLHFEVIENGVSVDPASYLITEEK